MFKLSETVSPGLLGSMPEIELDIVILFVTLLAKTVEVIANQLFCV